MSLFEEFTVAVNQWREARIDYRRRSTEFLVHFANAFREYLGAPEQYLDRVASRALSYVQPMKATADENGIYSFNVADSTYEWLRRNEEGQWVTGLQLAINEDPTSLRIIYFWYLIRFVL